MSRENLNLQEDDPAWDVIKRYGLTPTDISTAILAYAYTMAKESKEDKVSASLNKGFTQFRHQMRNVGPKEFREIYDIR